MHASDFETCIIWMFQYLHAELGYLLFDIVLVLLFLPFSCSWIDMVIDYKCAIKCLLVFKASNILDLTASTLVLVDNVPRDIGCLLLMIKFVGMY